MVSGWEGPGRSQVRRLQCSEIGGFDATRDHECEPHSLTDWLTGDRYDGNGNTTNSAKGTDTYDSMDRLVNRNSGGVVIVYNGDGQRVKKTVGGVTTYYLVDEQNLTGYAQVVEELQVVSGNLTPVRVYTYGLDLLNQDQLISGSWALSWYGYDGHGSVRFLTDESGYVTDTYDYDAFGNLINQLAAGTPTPNLYRYTGEQWDPDLGFYYLRARYSNPETGRFWNRDTYEGDSQDPLSLHKYLYCHANPVNGVDPTGNMNTASFAGGALIGLDSQAVKAKSDISKGLWAKEFVALLLFHYWRNFLLAYFTLTVHQNLTIARALESIERDPNNKDWCFVYNYSALANRQVYGLPAGTWVTQKGSLTYDQAVSITNIRNAAVIYVYRIKVRVTELEPDESGLVIWGDILQFRLSVPVGSGRVSLSKTLIKS